MYRLNIQFNERQRTALEGLAQELGTTKAGVLRKALSLLEVTLRERRVGNQIGIVRENRIIREVVGIN